MRSLIVLLVLVVFVRFFHLVYPLGELHSWRQADTAAVARNLNSYGVAMWLPFCQIEHRHIGSQGRECRVPLLNPQFDSYVTIDGKAAWMDGKSHSNDTRNHFAEFPIYQALVAQSAMIFNQLSFLKEALVSVSFWVDAGFAYVDKGSSFLEPKEFDYFVNNFRGIPFDLIVFSGRFVSLISTVVSVVALYFLVKFYFPHKVALLASAVYGLLPYSVFWSRTVLPDTMMVMWVLLGLYMFHLWLFNYQKGDHFFSRSLVYLVLSGIFFALALLMKVFVLFLVIPIVFLLYIKFGFGFVRLGALWICALIVISPFILWRWWIHIDQLRLTGIPASSWLFNGTGIRLKPAWWYWLFQTRLDHFMFNFTGLALVSIGGLFYRFIVSLYGSIKYFAMFWLLALLSCFFYLLVFATGNVQHEYYQLPLVPFLSVFVSLGFWYVWDQVGVWAGVFHKSVLVIFLFLMVLFGSFKVKDWYSTHAPSYIIAARRADVLLPKDATVIADFGGDTTMLYYTARPGWSIMELNIEAMISRGATHYISAHRTEGVNDLARRYLVVEQNDEYVILDLTQQNYL